MFFKWSPRNRRMATGCSSDMAASPRLAAAFGFRGIIRAFGRRGLCAVRDADTTRSHLDIPNMTWAH